MKRRKFIVHFKNGYFIMESAMNDEEVSILAQACAIRLGLNHEVLSVQEIKE